MTESIVLLQSKSKAGYDVFKDVSEGSAVEICSKFDALIGERLSKTIKKINVIEKEILADPDKVCEYLQFCQAGSGRDDLLTADLANRKGEEISARVDQYHRYLDVGSTILWENRGRSGKARFLSVTWPNFSWSPVCFNDKASSALAWGGNILFEHSWYRGRRLYMIGVFRADDFNEFGFDDLASSYIGF